LTHHHNILSKTDTACTQSKFGMVSFKGEFIMVLQTPKQISASSRALTFHPLQVCQSRRNRVRSGILLSHKSLQPASLCVSVSSALGRREPLHVIEVLTCLRQECVLLCFLKPIDPTGLFSEKHTRQTCSRWTDHSYDLCSAQKCRDSLAAYSRAPYSVGNVVG